MPRIRISAGSVTMAAELDTSETAKRVLEALPLSGQARTWGDEVYFDTTLALPEENPHPHVPPGAVAYWPPGKAICIFFGQTPASPVNVIGKVLGNPRDLAAVSPGDAVRITPAPQD
ncbi:MAG: cyclophilin-like fold protein [Planctomycetota bacterium]